MDLYNHMFFMLHRPKYITGILCCSFASKCSWTSLQDNWFGQCGLTQWIISCWFPSFSDFSLPPVPLPIHLPSVQVIALWPVLIRWKEVRITLATTICSLPGSMGSSCKDWRNNKTTSGNLSGVLQRCIKMCYLINLVSICFYQYFVRL